MSNVQTPPKLLLTLVVEYEPEQVDDLGEAAKELIEHARGYGRPVSCVVTGVPSTLTFRT